MRKRQKYTLLTAIYFFLLWDYTKLKNIIIADYTTHNYFFCTFYIANCTNCKYKFF